MYDNSRFSFLKTTATMVVSVFVFVIKTAPRNCVISAKPWGSTRPATVPVHLWKMGGLALQTGFVSV